MCKKESVHAVVVGDVNTVNVRQSSLVETQVNDSVLPDYDQRSDVSTSLERLIDYSNEVKDCLNRLLKVLEK